MDKFVVLVKGQIAHYENQIARFSPNHPRYRPDQIALYRRLIVEHRDLLVFLEHQKALQWTAAAPQPSPSKNESMQPVMAESTEPERTSAVRPDLSDLPPELLAELSEGAKGATDQLVTIIVDRGGSASLDDILIDLYRKHGEISKRNIIANKLYRLSKRQQVWSVPGKKGIYTTTKPTHAEDSESENDEGPDAATSGPSSNEQGVAGSPDRPLNPSPVGSTPTASTHLRRKLLSEAASPPFASEIRRRI